MIMTSTRIILMYYIILNHNSKTLTNKHALVVTFMLYVQFCCLLCRDTEDKEPTAITTCLLQITLHAANATDLNVAHTLHCQLSTLG